MKIRKKWVVNNYEQMQELLTKLDDYMFNAHQKLPRDVLIILIIINQYLQSLSIVLRQ